MTHNRLFSALYLLAFSVACTGGVNGLNGKGTKKKSDSDSASSIQKQDDAGTSSDAAAEEFRPATEAADVAGSYLTCGRATDAAEISGDDGVAYGCVFRTKRSGAKLRSAAARPTATATLDTGSVVKPVMRLAASTSPWHFHFGMPPESVGHVRKLSITATFGGEATTKETDKVDETNAAEVSAAHAPVAAASALQNGRVYLFVTASSNFQPGINFSSPAAADAVCNDAAKSLGGKWVALLFCSNGVRMDMFNIDNRVYNVANDVISKNVDDFWVDMSHNDRVLDEAMLDPLANGGDPYVWVGMSLSMHRNDIEPPSDTCNDWSSSQSGATGVVGTLRPQGSEDWLGAKNTGCNEGHRLYCISSK